MQHGHPVPEEEDPGRPLSERGRMDVRKVADFLTMSGVKVEEVFHSGKTRARETAEIMVSRLNPDAEPQQRAGLSPLDDVREMATYIKGTEKYLMIAGHLPHLAKLTSLLVAGEEDIPVVRFQQGGVVCLERDEQARWSVAWMVVPAIIKGSA